MADLPITPQTKVAELLDAYPELEDVLIGMTPAFKKLKNPVLRRTVAKLASLETAAGMAKLEPRAMVRTLREAVGQSVDDVPTVGDDAAGAIAPEWVNDGTVVATIDADALLAQGQMPLTEVLAHARQLEGRNLVRVTVSFKPTPMIEALEKQGFRTFLRPGIDGNFEFLIASSA